MEGKQEPRAPTLQEQGYVLARGGMVVLMFVALSFNYCIRVNMNLAIVAMVDNDYDNDNYGSSNSSSNNSSSSDEWDVCPFPSGNMSTAAQSGGDFKWNEFEQSLVISSYFWGYIWWQIPGGRMAERVGPRLVMGVALLGAALLTLLIPVAAATGHVALVVTRVAIGFFAGSLPSSCQALLAAWAPPSERALLVAFVFTGCQAGTVVGFLWTAAMLETAGWEAVFYVQGAAAVVWAVLLLLLLRNSPAEALWISPAEREYILASVGDQKQDKVLPMPWAAALTSPPLWGVVLASFCNSWGFSTLLAGLPLYMDQILHKDIKANAAVSAVPYMGMWLTGLALSAATDALRRRDLVSTTVARKAATAIALLIPAICLVSLSWVECNFAATFALLFVAVSVNGGVYAGFIANHIDIAPNFAGTLYGITNTGASIPAFLAPMTTGALTNGQQTLGQWNKIFYLSAGFFAVGALVFLILGDGREQYWNRVAPPPPHNNRNNTVTVYHVEANLGLDLTSERRCIKEAIY